MMRPYVQVHRYIRSVAFTGWRTKFVPIGELMSRNDNEIGEDWEAGYADAPPVDYSAGSGEQGPQGEQGPKGDPGETGPEGPAGSIDGVGAGGVLSGSYPNPGFAVNMATQAELDAGLAQKADVGAAWPIGSIYTSVVSTNPNTLLGFGTWVALAAGRVLVGQSAGDADFDTAKETGGAKTVAGAGAVSQPTFSGTPFSSVINHTHTVTVTDPGHTHTQASQTATTGAASTWEHGAIDTSSTGAETLPTGSSTTGITATTANPAGGVASITPAGTVSQPTFTGSATSVVQPYLVVYFWERTA